MTALNAAGSARTFAVGGIVLLALSWIVYTQAVEGYYESLDQVTALAVDSEGRLNVLGHALFFPVLSRNLIGVHWSFVLFPLVLWTGVALLVVAAIKALRTKAGST